MKGWLPIQSLAGLRQGAWLVVGPGYSREDLKEELLTSGRGLVSEAITTREQLALKILESSPGFVSRGLLSPLARQEVLRLLMEDRRISAHLPELKRLKRQGAFFRRLDLALQSGRGAFAHPEEEAVYEERLVERFGTSPIREEVRHLARAYEAWLEGMGVLDPPLLFRKALECLRSGNWLKPKHWPPKLLLCSVESPESLEREFWEALGEHFEISRPPVEQFSKELAPAIDWELWHTQDDSCQRLADLLLSELRNVEAAEAEQNPNGSPESDRAGQVFDENVVLIADQPSVRRSLKRALKQAGLPEADPRDPTRLQTDEAVKWALLPLELVAGNFERSRVCAWARYQFPTEISALSEEIAARGIRLGLKSYTGGKLATLEEKLTHLSQCLAGRKTCEQLRQAHLQILTEALEALQDGGDLNWLPEFFEGIWKELEEDWRMLGLEQRSAPALYWLEKIGQRLAQTPAPVEKLRPREGLRVYRLQQAPSPGFLGGTKSKTVWIVGLSEGWLTGSGVGDYWYGEREREVLAAEFSIRSAIQLREERLRTLRGWIGGASRVVYLDSLYASDGREKESLLPLLKELHEPWENFPLEAPIEKGANDRWVSSFSAIRPAPPHEVALPPLEAAFAGGLPELSATTLDRYSKCAFQSLIFDRWRVRDLREPDCELWADIRGNILHQAVKILLQPRADGGSSSETAADYFSCSPSEALELAWKLKPPRGLLKSAPMETYLKTRMLRVLEKFCEKEREYRRRSGARTVRLDEGRLNLEFPGFRVIGTPDRIDETSDGIFLMDYKTSGGLPNGTEMVESGYRLQLPFYALAAAREAKRPVLGVQFIELNTKAGRGSGIFFKKYNGKEPGKLTSVTARSKSLVAWEPDEVWSRVGDHLLAHGSSYLRGEFKALPKKPAQECDSCPAGDVCGVRRRSGRDEGEGGQAEGGKGD